MGGSTTLKTTTTLSRGAMVLGLIAAGATGVASPALAQEAQPAAAPAAAPSAEQTATQDGQTDIVVTASRQSVGSQKVPIALTAVGQEQLANQGITSASQLNELSPSLFVLSSASAGSPRFTLRGLTFSDTQANGSPAVATYIDDVYQSFQFGINPQIFDVQRVEILRGPQGTTFGRNTTGGAIAYFNNVPTNKEEGSVAVRVGGGKQAQRFIQGVINVPLIDDKLALRVSVGAEKKGDFIFDETLGKKRGGGDSQTGRVQLRYTPSSETSINLTVFGAQRDGDGPVTFGQFLPGTVAAGRTALTPYDAEDNYKNYGSTLRIEQDLGDFTLTSITHYRQTKYDVAYDLDGLPADSIFYAEHATATQYGQEVRISSDPTRRVSGIIGGYFEHDRVRSQLNYAATQNGIGGDYNNDIPSLTKTTTYAAFANLTFKVTDTLSLIGGIRKSVEKKTNVGTADYFLDYNYDWTQQNIELRGARPVTPSQSISYNLRQKAKPLTWDATINFNPDSNLLIFARTAKGFRSGGFNAAPLVSDPSGLPVTDLDPYFGESVRSYEGGVKASFLNNRLRVNASAYHYDYSNQQITEYINVQAVTKNAGKSKVDGGELEITASPSRNLEIRGSASYTDARYTVYSIPAIGVNYAGNTLVQAPKWNLNGSVNYTRPLTDTYDITTNANVAYRSKIYFDSANRATLSAPAQAVLNFRLGVENNTGKGFSLVGYVNNITNKRPLSSGFTFIPDVYYVKLFVDPGRTFGVDLSYKW